MTSACRLVSMMFVPSLAPASLIEETDCDPERYSAARANTMKNYCASEDAAKMYS